MALLNERLKERRLALNMTLLEVAEYLGVKEATAQRYESGDIKNIKHETIVSLAELFECSPAYLMGWEEKPQTSITKEEQEHLHKYRSIDEKGKHTVDTVLEMEYNRCKAGDNSKVVALKPVDDKSHLIPDAAHRRTDLSEEELNDNIRNKHDDDIMNDPNF